MESSAQERVIKKAMKEKPTKTNPFVVFFKKMFLEEKGYKLDVIAKACRAACLPPCTVEALAVIRSGALRLPGLVSVAAVAGDAGNCSDTVTAIVCYPSQQ